MVSSLNGIVVGGLLGFCLDALALSHMGERAVLGEELGIVALLGDAAFF